MPTSGKRSLCFVPNRSDLALHKMKGVKPEKKPALQYVPRTHRLTGQLEVGVPDMLEAAQKQSNVPK